MPIQWLDGGIWLSMVIKPMQYCVVHALSPSRAPQVVALFGNIISKVIPIITDALTPMAIYLFLRGIDLFIYYNSTI